jgi:hypothetical protein
VLAAAGSRAWSRGMRMALSSRTRTRVSPSMHLPTSPATLLVRTPTSIMDVTPYHLVCYLGPAGLV